MENNFDIQKLFNAIGMDFIEKIRHSNKENLGVFRALKKISNKTGLWELKLLLIIAEYQPITPEKILNKMKNEISKSSIYRKLTQFTKKRLLKKDEENNAYSIQQEYKSLTVTAQLYHKIKIQKDEEKID